MTAEINWLKLAERLQDVQAQMIHHPKEGAPRLYGYEFYAEALRRTFEYRTNDGTDGQRQLPYESVATHFGLMAKAEADYLTESHTIMSRLNMEAAQREAKEAREETRRVYRDAARDLAKWLREWCNNRTVPARFRRQGVLIAANWIDPDRPDNAHSYQVPEDPR